MCGLPGQTAETWRWSLEQALRHAPEELYLYPTYARPLTTLGRRVARDGSISRSDDARPALYAQACEHLGAAGYEQVSMRMFRRAGVTDGSDVPAYCCQDDGMVGLGCGARSYTAGLHYASEYAVGARGVRDILDRWMARGDDTFAVADYGIVLSPFEQRRRWLISTLLARQGVGDTAYRDRFGDDLATHAPELAVLAERALVEVRDGAWHLTETGVASSDVIGPWLVSASIRAAMAGWEGA
jgi:oxygen-independent coproporphyrinogen-3 oxidase